MVILICSRCGKEYDQHTLRELHNMDCTQYIPKETPAFTAKTGLVNPEALDDTGEEFNLSAYRRRPRSDTDQADKRP